MSKLKILIPTDFSVQAEYAFLLAGRLGEKIPLDIHFLHVLNVPDTVTMDPSGNIQTCGDIDAGFVEKQKEIAQRNLNALRTQYGSHIHTHIVLGKTTEEITGFAEKNKVDLIVMGTKGAWGLQEKVSGSETQVIARQSAIPVLSMMCDRSDLIIRNLLLVHDFTSPAAENISLMKMIADAFGARIHLLQIISDTADHPSLHKGMEQFAHRNGINNFEMHLIKDSDVEKGVIHFNQMHDMDIICLGTHARTGISRLLHPSATEKLINHLFKPILTFHLNGE